jgi:hypothetical protein
LSRPARSLRHDRVVNAGSSLRWPDGSPTGVAYRENMVREEPRAVGELRCVTPTEIRGWSLDGLEVCVDGQALREVDRRPEWWRDGVLPAVIEGMRDQRMPDETRR